MSDSSRGHSDSPPRRLGDLASATGARLKGDPDKAIRGVASLENATAADLSFLADARLREQAATSVAGAVITSDEYSSLFSCDLLVSADPYRDFIVVARHFLREIPIEGVSRYAQVNDQAILEGEG